MEAVQGVSMDGARLIASLRRCAVRVHRRRSLSLSSPQKDDSGPVDHRKGRGLLLGREDAIVSRLFGGGGGGVAATIASAAVYDKPLPRLQRSGKPRRHAKGEKVHLESRSTAAAVGVDVQPRLPEGRVVVVGVIAAGAAGGGRRKGAGQKNKTQASRDESKW